MKILVIEPEKKPVIKEIDGSLDSMQKIVGGIIQALYPFAEEVACICNDEGKLLGLPLNRELRDDEGRCYDILCGTFFLVGCPANADCFTSLTEQQIEQFSEYFAVPRVFLNVNGKLHIIPYIE